MILSFHPCLDADAHILLGDRALSTADIRLIACAEAVILPQGCRPDLYEICTRYATRTFPRYDIRFRYPGKTGQSLLFEQLEVPHPRTLRWTGASAFRTRNPDPARPPHPFPFFIKDDKSHEAQGVHFIRDEKDLDEVIFRLLSMESSGASGFVTQDYIPCGGNVVRAVIIGKKTLAYWKRPARPGQIVTTLAGNAFIDHTWKPQLLKKAEQVLKDFSQKTGINLAAIDVVFPMHSKEPGPLFLEINYFFGRRGLGGSRRYYGMLYEAVRNWLMEQELDPEAVRLV